MSMHQNFSTNNTLFNANTTNLPPVEDSTFPKWLENLLWGLFYFIVAAILYKCIKCFRDVLWRWSRQLWNTVTGSPGDFERLPTSGPIVRHVEYGFPVPRSLEMPTLGLYSSVLPFDSSSPATRETSSSSNPIAALAEDELEMHTNLPEASDHLHFGSHQMPSLGTRSTFTPQNKPSTQRLDNTDQSSDNKSPRVPSVEPESTVSPDNELITHGQVDADDGQIKTPDPGPSAALENATTCADRLNDNCGHTGTFHSDPGFISQDLSTCQVFESVDRSGGGIQVDQLDTNSPDLKSVPQELSLRRVCRSVHQSDDSDKTQSPGSDATITPEDLRTQHISSESEDHADDRESQVQSLDFSSESEDHTDDRESQVQSLDFSSESEDHAEDTLSQVQSLDFDSEITSENVQTFDSSDISDSQTQSLDPDLTISSEDLETYSISTSADHSDEIDNHSTTSSGDLGLRNLFEGADQSDESDNQSTTSSGDHGGRNLFEGADQSDESDSHSTTSSGDLGLRNLFEGADQSEDSSLETSTLDSGPSVGSEDLTTSHPPKTDGHSEASR